MAARHEKEHNKAEKVPWECLPTTWVPGFCVHEPGKHICPNVTLPCKICDTQPPSRGASR
jgi:hypothetical protein